VLISKESNEVQSGKVPSLALAVSRHGRILWEDAFGFANKESQVLATPHTRYHLASVPKTFTAAAIMKLQERGALKLDDAVNRYLGKAKLWSLTWNAAEATVRQVATHTAGLTTYDQACFPDTPECDTSYDTMIRRATASSFGNQEYDSTTRILVTAC
jgi:CubicO group peptidase (beta-lactamase class C family)